ncbi:MAG: hypothetical protein GC160_13200 [Acidobacteria bacterium]|nr:hypothetical protein [Acidobacteriota bacterium]
MVRSLLISLVLTAAGSALGAAEMFPLNPGSVWEYRAEGGQSLVIKTGLTQLYSEGRTYARLTGYVDEPVWARLNEAGNLVYLDEETRNEHVLTSFERPSPGWYEAPLRGCAQESRPHSDVSYAGPTGRLEGVMPVRYRNFSCADAGLEVELFAANVGMVSRTVTTLAGPMEYKLAYADTGSVQLALRRAVTLRLALEPQGKDAILATMRLTGDPDVAPKIELASSQEVEAVLRDATGRVVWRWSDGRVFLPATMTRQAFNLSWEMEIPLGAGADRLPAGQYTVEAWLNTVGPEPRYRTMADLTVEPEAVAARTVRPLRARSRQ